MTNLSKSTRGRPEMGLAELCNEEDESILRCRTPPPAEAPSGVQAGAEINRDDPLRPRRDERREMGIADVVRVASMGRCPAPRRRPSRRAFAGFRPAVSGAPGRANGPPQRFVGLPSARDPLRATPAAERKLIVISSADRRLERQLQVGIRVSEIPRTKPARARGVTTS